MACINGWRAIQEQEHTGMSNEKKKMQHKAVVLLSCYKKQLTHS